MLDGRKYLPVGTRLELENGGLYEITGEPIGFGGGSIIYPAKLLKGKTGELQTDGIFYALKECYPASEGNVYFRDARGEIVAQNGGCDAEDLARAQELLLKEEEISKKIYQTAARMLPIREKSKSVSLTLPGMETTCVSNTVTVMDSLSNKGQSLSQCLRQSKRLTPLETFRIIQQLLFALQEVHQAGFLHLDIQDGNVFLRGTLQEKNELLTLIDFGCARPMIDGRTAPITDKAIFTTKGFSAPEILCHNEGNLCLGPEADLYSVGCLALCLLTGHKADHGMLLANRNGRYLKPNDLRRIKCPRHLEERMQQILARALEKEPQDRYHSAEEMLGDVKELVEALQPAVSTLHGVVYDAFICYKHGPVDSAAALTLQRLLEHFHHHGGAPRNRRPFRRVFVDEGELSSCADFGQQIREALKNSKWLIVICSPDTPLSPWVQLEIDTFLEYHSRSQILAVLTGGDEKNAFPPQLQGGEGKSEVLAAHAQGEDLKKVLQNLRGDALLKLAAPMLGIPFDNLKQRQKIYMLRRVAAVTAGFLLAATGFAAYAAVQNARIQKEYRNALLNESRFLTVQAEKRLADNDPLGALELMLKALPSEDQPRPLLPEAEEALAEALGIYKTPSTVKNTMTAVGLLENDDPNFFLDDSGKYLFTWKSGRTGVRIWDAESAFMPLVGEIVTDEQINYTAEECLLPQGNSLMIQLHRRIVSVDYLTGRENWAFEYQNEDDFAYILSMGLSPDHSKAVVVSGVPGGLFFTGDQSPRELELDVLAADTGEVLKHMTFDVRGDQFTSSGFVTVSADMKWAAVCTYNFEITALEGRNSVYLINLETGENYPLFPPETAVSAVRFFEDRVAVLRFSGATLSTPDVYTLHTYMQPINCLLETYDLKTGQLCWSREQVCYSKTESNMDIGYTQYDTGEESGTGLLYTYADRCTLLDWNTGRVVRDYQLHASSVNIELLPNGFASINADGSQTKTKFTMDSTDNIQYWNRFVSGVVRNGENCFVQSDSDLRQDYSIRKYQADKFDAWYQPIFEADGSEQRPGANTSELRVYATVSMPGGNRIILARQNQVCLVDTAAGETWIHDIPEEQELSFITAFSNNILGISGDGTTLYWYRSSHDYGDPSSWIRGRIYYAIDLISGQIRELQQPPKPMEYLTVYDTVFDDEKLFFTAESSETGKTGVYVFLWDLKENTMDECCYWSLPGWMDAAEDDEVYVQFSLKKSEREHRLYFALCTQGDRFPRTLVQLDPETGETVRIPVAFPPAGEVPAWGDWMEECFQWNSDGTQAVFGYEKRIYSVDDDGKLLFTIPVTEEQMGVAWLQFAPDQQSLLVITQDGVVTRYGASDGREMSRLVMNDYGRGICDVFGMRCEFVEDSWMMVYTGYDGLIVDLSGEDFVVKAVVNQCVDYDPVRDRLIVANDRAGDKTTVGSFPRYTLEVLIQKAREALDRD